MHVQPYLFFDGRCDEALAFYQDALGAKVEFLMRFKDSPEPPMMDVPGDKVMHASFRIGETKLMASDGECGGKAHFQGFSLTYNAQDETEAKRAFEALSEGGQVQLPLTRTFFSPCFGMVKDKFDLGWMVIVDGEH